MYHHLGHNHLNVYMYIHIHMQNYIYHIIYIYIHTHSLGFTGCSCINMIGCWVTKKTTCCEHSHRCRPMSTTSFFAVVPTSICASNLRRGPPTNNKQQGGPMKGCFRADMTDSKGVCFWFFVAIEKITAFFQNQVRNQSQSLVFLLSSGSSGSASWGFMKIHPMSSWSCYWGKQQRISKFCQNVFLQMSSHP